MALGDAYATSDQLKGYIGQATADTTDNTRITDALTSASRAIEKFCHRQFNAAGSATARLYFPDTDSKTRVDDISTTTGLVIKTDTDGDGTYETTWVAADYQLEPLNNVVDGETGWPYYDIRAVGSNRLPCTYGTTVAPLQVTANWGWAAVPAVVKQACLIQAAYYFRFAGAPLGVDANAAQFGPIRVRPLPQVTELLMPYVQDPVLVG